MRVLVTGGSGFIGRASVATLFAAGHDVEVLDLVEPASGPVWHRGDVTDPSAWPEASEFGAVVHLAAKVGVEQSPSDVVDFVAVNDTGTAVGLAALAASGFGGRFVLGGSMVVYGPGSYTCDQHGPVRPRPRTAAALSVGRFEPPCPVCGATLTSEPVPETAPIDPRSIYAATKAHQEHLVTAVAAACGWPVVLLRFHNVYGPGLPLDTPYAGVAARFRQDLLAGRAPRVFEDGRQRRDFVHVDDVAAAVVAAVEGDADAVGPFNVASGSPRTVLELAEALQRTAPFDAPAPVCTGEFRAGDVRHVVGSTSRAADILGFRATIPFEQGLATLWSDLA